MDEERPGAKITLISDAGEEYTVELDEVRQSQVDQLLSGDRFRLEVKEDEFDEELPVSGWSDLLNWEAVVTIEGEITVAGPVDEVDVNMKHPQVKIYRTTEREHDGNNLLYD